MTERRVSVRERARELEALAAREASPQLAHRARLARRLGLTRADSEPGAEGSRAGPCHCCAQPSGECLCSGDGGRLLSVPHVPRKKASAPAITPLRGAPSAGLVAEGSSCADIRLAWEALCSAAQGPEASAISDEPRDENSAPILGAAQGDSARGPLDAILQSLEEICSQLEEAPGHAEPVMLPDAGEAASRLNPRCARSQPSSPRVRAKPQLPAYLTLARRARHDDALEIEQIKTILASIDFSRYRKKRATLAEEGGQPAALQGSRLRELTEKLKSPVGAPGRPSDAWNRRPAPVCRSASFSTSDLPSVPATPRETLTLPRKAPASRPLVRAAGRGDRVAALDDVAMSSLSLDSAVESIVDETPYQREASPPADKRRVQQQRGCRFAPLDDDGSRGPPQPPEKRKRRKGLAPVEGPKKETGRSLTYPPQRKTAEQELAFGSVDSNGLKALGGRPEKQPSDLSLADSHFCPSEALGEETFGDVVQSLSSRPEQPEQPRQEKSKKKHLSDPSADNTGAAATELLLGACCRSEPQLSCSGALHKRQHSGPAALSRAAPQPPPPPPLSDSERATSDTERTCSPQRRYSKKRLRGPYGEMLEQEMRKTGEMQKAAFCEELSFLLPADKPQTTSSMTTTTGAATTTSTATCAKSSTNASATTSAARSRPAHLSNSLSLDDTQLKSSSASLEAVPEASAPRRKISANYPLTGSDTASLMVCNSSNASEETAGKAQPVSWLTAAGDSGSGARTPAPSPVPPSPQLSTGAPERAVRDTHHERSHSSPVTSSDGSPLLVRTGSLRRHQDTRTHVVGELYDTEKSYVESLQILVNKYMRPLKSPDTAGTVDSGLVDEIFYQIPEILSHHEAFLEVLRQRLSCWDTRQKVGDVFVEAFTKQPVIDTYTAFINNWKSAKEAIKMATQAKPAFAKFLENTSREHKGKLALDALLIMPVQRIPRYELLIKELIKHTQHDHPDHQLLVLAQKEVHELALKINRMEREAFQHEQMQQRVRDIEQLIEGVIDLVQPDRTFIRYDFVTIPGGLGTKKDRCLFLFSDLLLITSIKRKSGTMRKTSPSSSSPAGFGFSVFDMNKYKLLLRFSLDNLDILKPADVGLKKAIREAENLEEDMSLITQISELASRLNCPHQALDDAVKEITNSLNKQMAERQSYDLQLLNLQLSVTTPEGVENLAIIFPSTEKRSSWEVAFNEAKQKLALSTDRRPPPEFLHPVPIRKTRAGLQFTCAVATLGLNAHGLRDVWVCNSDGYVGQVCVLSLQPEPTVMSCNGVCNARILCIASIPAASPVLSSMGRRKSLVPESNALASTEAENKEQETTAPQPNNNGNIQLDSESSEDEEEEEEGNSESQEEEQQTKPQESSKVPKEEVEETDNHFPTMWLGTEDGCIHVYNCNDNIRIKKNKMKVQHSAAVHCIIYLDNRVFVSLSSGEIVIYRRESGGGWNTSDPQKVQVGSSVAPVLRMLAVAGKLWCGCQNYIKVLSTASLEVEHSFQVSSDSSRAVLCMVTSGLGVWLAIQHSAVIRLFHATTYECLQDVNIAPAVTKMLSACDDIIRQHKAACLRVTALLACKDLLWVGTSAGVLLTLPLPHLTSSTSRLGSPPNIVGVPHGHTGHVRFLTAVETTEPTGSRHYHHRSLRCSRDSGAASASVAASMAGRRASLTPAAGCRLLVISGGDGYEDFRSAGLSEAAGRDDSTNHLLLWQV
ncbi:rho guanine nucleotide exchange factor 17 [Amblyomma americanum]